MANERDEGFAALQSGDLQTAQAKLESAVQQDAQDAQAHLYLGGVYHRLGQHANAIQTLTRAVELQPSSAPMRYNLGMALEHGGETAQALTAYQQAVALMPDYTLAQQALERVRQATAPPANSSSVYNAPAAQSAAPVYTAPVYNPAAASAAYQTDQTQAMPSNAANVNGPTLNAPPAYAPAARQATDLAGNPLPDAAPAYAAPAYGQPPTGYAPGGTTGPGGYATPQWSPFGGTDASVKADAFNLVQAFKDWGQTLATPGRFFNSEEGASGFAAPMAMTLAYMLVYGLVSLLVVLIGGNASRMPFVLIGVPVLFLMFLITWFIWAGLNHGISRLFGGSGEYSGSFRASVYSAAPFITLSLVSSLIGAFVAPKPIQTSMAEPQARVIRAQYSSSSPYGSSPYGSSSYGSARAGRSPFGASGGGLGKSAYNSPYGPYGSPYGVLGHNPVGTWLTLIGMIWSMVLMARGMASTQRMSLGAAAGMVVLSVILTCVLFIGLAIVAGAALVGAVMSTAH